MRYRVRNESSVAGRPPCSAPTPPLFLVRAHSDLDSGAMRLHVLPISLRFHQVVGTEADERPRERGVVEIELCRLLKTYVYRLWVWREETPEG